MTSFTPALNNMGVRIKSIGHGWLLLVLVLAAQAIVDVNVVPDQVAAVGGSFGSTLPFLLLAVAFAAYSKATGADALIAKAFTGREVQMVMVAALFGALSPFCSCGVIPIIAALLAMGVPLSAVMAFWLASPLMDPTMFAMTTGILGWEFAVAKTAAAAGIGMGGGYLTMALGRTGVLANPLREGVGNGGCGASSVRNTNPNVHWKFWQESARRATFAKNAWSNLLFLGQWLALAFLLEAVMIAYLPQEAVAGALGGDSWFAIPLAAMVGIPCLSERLCCAAIGQRPDRAGYEPRRRYGLPGGGWHHLHPRRHRCLGVGAAAGVCGLYGQCICRGDRFWPAGGIRPLVVRCKRFYQTTRSNPEGLFQHLNQVQ